MEIAIKYAPLISMFVAFVALGFQFRVHRKNMSLKQREQSYKERDVYFDSQQTWSFPSLKSKPKCVITIANRDTRDVALSSIQWSFESGSTFLEVSRVNEKPEKIHELLPLRLVSSESFQFEFDPDELVDTIFFSLRPGNYMKAELISRIRLAINLSTGESKEFMIGPQLQLYMLDNGIDSWFFKAIGRYLVRRAHNKAKQ